MNQFLRFVINGLLATLLHFLVLTFCMEVLAFRYASLAAVVASVVGISASFLGNRHFVFQDAQQAVGGQLLRFLTLYGVVALLHAGVLLLWSDVYRLDYRIGFVLATALQIGLTFVGNKRLVFRT